MYLLCPWLVPCPHYACLSQTAPPLVFGMFSAFLLRRPDCWRCSLVQATPLSPWVKISLTKDLPVSVEYDIGDIG